MGLPDFFKVRKSEEEAKFLEQEKIYRKGIASLKDILAPSALKINANHIRIGSKYLRTIFVYTYPRYLQTTWFSPVINLDLGMDIAMFIHPAETNIILKNLKKRAAQVESQIAMGQEKGMVRDPILETAHKDIESLRDALQTGTERFFKYSLYITVYADTPKALNKKSAKIISILSGGLVYAKEAIFQTKPAFTSTLPLCQDKLAISNNMNTGPLSTTFPFVSSDLTSDQGILYGINRHNNSLILFDRFSMENANMTLFGKAGSGKSYAIKLEILRSLMFDTEIIVIDPENEYKYVAEVAGGTFVPISLTSKAHLNPFDLSQPSEEETPADILRSNIIELTGLLKLMLGGLSPKEESLVDEALHQTYALKDITEESDFSGVTVPTMSDFEKILKGMKGTESLQDRLKKYTTGTFAGFTNMPTNVSIREKLVVFSIRDMEEVLRPMAMYIILHYIWNIVRSQLKKRTLVIDEAWWMMKNEESASFLLGIAKRARKYYLGVTTITQDISDFLESRYGKPIITNSSLQLLMKQSPAAIDSVAETFYLSDEEKYLLLEANIGEGIFFAGLKRAAIKVVASFSEDQVITTDPAQLLEIERAKEELAREGS